MSVTDDAARETTDSGDVADEVEGAVRRNPWLESVAQVGWVAKGVVYLLMGATATQIARQEPSDDDASPSGALNRVMEQPGGRALLAVLAVGLVLYSLWRVLSVVMIRGSDLSAWAHRVGYGFSALVYGVLAFTAGRTFVRGSESGRDSTVEKLSRAAMDSSVGRGAVATAGVVTILIGAYFVVGKGIMRTFADDLRDVDSTDDEPIGLTLVIAGVAGWVGRGIVTVLVGFFVTRAAVQFDPDEARGFDGALRTVATTSFGTGLVWISAAGLILYGAFCILSHPRRHLEDNS